MFHLPEELQRHIYDYDNTYREYYTNVIHHIEDYFEDLENREREYYSN